MDGYKVKFTPLQDKGNLLGVASVSFMDSIVIRNVKLLNGRHGLFIAMPQQRNYKGDYIDCAYPLTKEVRDEMTQAVIDAYGGGAEFAEITDDDDELPL